MEQEPHSISCSNYTTEEDWAMLVREVVDVSEMEGFAYVHIHPCIDPLARLRDKLNELKIPCKTMTDKAYRNYVRCYNYQWETEIDPIVVCLQPRGVIGIERKHILRYRYVSDDPTDSDPKDTKARNAGVTAKDPVESSLNESRSAPTIGTANSESPTTTEVESKSFGGDLEEDNNKRRALNKPDDGTEDCTDQNGNKKQKG